MRFSLPNHRKVIHWKTLVVSVLVIALNVTGNYSLIRGLHHIGVLQSWSPLPYIHAFANAWVAAGVTMMIGWLIWRLVLLSWADLSYVLPVTAISYVLTAVVGRVFLEESVSPLHWAGICAITAGVFITAVTFPETTPPEQQ